MKGHLARWYLYSTLSPGERYTKALATIEKALEILDKDSQLLHVKGMVYRSKVDQPIKMRNIDEKAVTEAAVQVP